MLNGLSAFQEHINFFINRGLLQCGIEALTRQNTVARRLHRIPKRQRLNLLYLLLPLSYGGVQMQSSISIPLILAVSLALYAGKRRIPFHQRSRLSFRQPAQRTFFQTVSD